MTYNKLYDIINVVMQELNTNESSMTEPETGTWNFQVQDISGQVVLQQNEEDDLLTVFMYLFVVPIPTQNQAAFYEELLRFNAVNPFIKYALHETYALVTITFQEFSFFTKEFFTLVVRRYLTFAAESRADLGTRYFDFSQEG
jgi:hypothetical protein